MAYIGPRGISLDEWDTWSDYAQSAALGWAAWEKERCPSGHHPADWDPDRGGDLLDRVRIGKDRCPVCAAFESAQEAFSERRAPGEFQVLEPIPEQSAAPPHDPSDGSDENSGEADGPAEQEQQADDDPEGRGVLSGADPAHDEQADEQG